MLSSCAFSSEKHSPVEVSIDCLRQSNVMYSYVVLTGGRDVQHIAGVLEEVEDWEALAGWLNIRTINIKQNCAHIYIYRKIGPLT